MQLPLDELRVLEWGRTSMAAYCGRLLADAGADVVKVESSEGDPARLRGPFLGDLPDPERSGLFLFLNVNKRGVCLDQARRGWRRTLSDLLGWADVLVTDFPPLEARALGLTWRRLHRAHSKLTLTSITPFGESGPYRDYLANDHVLCNMGGIAYATPGLPDRVDNPRREPPLRPGTPLAELIAGLSGATATLMSLTSTIEDGKGRHVKVSGHQAAASSVYYDVATFSYGRVVTGRRPVSVARMPNAVLPCKDGHVVIVAPWEHLWTRFVALMGNPDWADWEVFQTGLDRGANWDALYHLIADWTTRFTGEEILKMAQEARVPCFPAFSIGRAVDSDHKRERGFFWQTPFDGGREIDVPGSPFIMSRTPSRLRRPAPRLGEHTLEVMAGSANRRSAGGARWWDGDDRSKEETGPRHLPLEGIRVLDFGQVVSVPFCTRMMGWMGAEVILVETRKRPDFRLSPPFAYGRETPNTGASFNSHAMNKRSVTLNLATPQGRDLARALVKVSDVVVENYAAGTMDRMGLGYETLRRLRPDLVMLSLGAFGRLGEMSRYTALHSGVIMGSGMAAITGYRGDRPRLIGSILPDPISGTFSCMAILEALHHRRRTGEGQYIDISMSEVMAHMMPEAIFDYTVNGREHTRMGNRDRVHAPQGIYRCHGWDAWVGISVTSDDEWRALCSALGQPELADDPRYTTPEGRHLHHDMLDTIITSWTRGHSQREAVELLQEAGVPAGGSSNGRDLLNDPHLNAQKFIRRIDHPEAGRRRYMGMPWSISDIPPTNPRRAPLQGEHTVEVLEQVLGLTPSEIQQLEQDQAIY